MQCGYDAAPLCVVHNLFYKCATKEKAFIELKIQVNHRAVEGQPLPVRWMKAGVMLSKL
jgi:hypothetical protein